MIINVVNGVVYNGTCVIMKWVNEDVTLSSLTRLYGEDIIVLY